MRLGDVCAIKYGKDHKSLSDGNIPCYGSGGVMRYVDTALYCKNSVLIPRKGSLNNLYFIDTPFWTVDTLFYTEINEALIKPEFLYYQLKTLNLAGMNVGTAVPSLTAAVLNEIEIDVPPLSEQIEIGRILSTIDDKIALNTRINRNLEQMAQAIFKSWFVDFEPWCEVMPEDWRNGCLGDYCPIKSGYAFKSSWWQQNGIRVIKIKNITDDGFDFLDCSFVSNDKVSCATDFIAKTGDLLIAMTGATIGKFAIIPKCEEMLLVNQRVGKFFLGMNPLEKLPFLWCTLKQNDVFNEIINRGQGSAQPNVSPTDIMTISITIPSEDVLSSFNKTLYSCFETITTNAAENQKLANIRDTLLPRLMSGELKIPSEV